jgi:ferredoxin
MPVNPPAPRSARVGATNHLEVDRIACTGHGLCAELFPEWIELDEWGFPIVDPEPVTGEAARHAARAVEACPTLALLLEAESRA